ncbi:MAG: DUF4097 family beta strand repeat-containing protein [Terracidiphilus sp.]|jgi:DUF4097 and DUF4098 domain-containing protein YvlB
MSTPPNMPPGGGPPYPPYDPKAQWQAYREQQKAAWRAQRQAWKAQKYAWKAGYGGSYGGVYGPRVPSMVGPVILISIGIIALLIMTGHLAAENFWQWYSRWWPLLLILAGLALLAEWAIDIKREVPIRRRGSFIGLLFLLTVVGLGASGWRQMGAWNWNWNGDNDNFFDTFGAPEHDIDAQVLSTSIPANATVDIENPRGDVSITGGDGTAIQVQAHEEAFTDSDNNAKTIWGSEAPKATVSGSTVLIKSDGNNKGRVNLTVTVPRTAKVTVNEGRGEVTATGLAAGITASVPHGELHLNSITGPVEVHLYHGNSDVSIHDVNGDVTADGNANELTLSEIHGRLSTNGDIFGPVHMENITGPIALHTSVTDLDIAALPGDVTLDSDDLHVTEAEGSVRVSTHAKDVDLSQIYGDTSVDNRDGRIAIEPAGAYSITATNNKGDVEITLPPDAAGVVDGHTHNGEVVDDFDLSVSGDENKTVTGRIGNGGPRISLTSNDGDLHIKKGPAFPPPPPAAPAAPAAAAKAPTPPSAPHLKSSKALPQQPTAQ